MRDSGSLEPGSPLTYTPQLSMTPQDTAASNNSEYSGVAGWPAQPKLLPTVITCKPMARFTPAVSLQHCLEHTLSKPDVCNIEVYQDPVLGRHLQKQHVPAAQGAMAAATWRWKAPSTTGRCGRSCSALARTSPS